MSNRLLMLLNAFLSFAIGLLGLSSCHDEDEPCEYGVPQADYVAEGFVFDEEDMPLGGIQVYPLYGRESDTAITDTRGKYVMNEQRVHYNCTLVASDPNGVFASDTAYNVKREKIGRGDDHWYDGKFKINHTFHLKKK